MTPALRHVTKISSLSPKEIKGVLKLALEMKARPADYWDALKRRTLLMCFAVHKSKLSSRPTPSTRCLLDSVAVPVPHRATGPARPRRRREMT